jgi:hypothetical protein
MVWTSLLYGALAVLVAVIAWELLRRHAFAEGFTDGVVPEYFGKFFPRRSDVVPGQREDVDGWLRNWRYFEGYADVQRLGYKADFCRVVEKPGAPDTRIMACALAGQEGIDSLVYRTDSARAGMRFSRDNYFRDVNGDGRDDYVRILKVSKSPNDRWQALAVLADLTRFKPIGSTVITKGDGFLPPSENTLPVGSAEMPDNDPPPEMKDLLMFFEGIMVWYRWFDDMVDYSENTQISIAGDARVEEKPGLTETKGLEFNRLPAVSEDVPATADQFLKIGENARLEFDTIVTIRNLRAISVWAYFDEFTNNARIFDFGNGAGRDNVLLGIEGRGNTKSAFGALNARPSEMNAVCSARAAPETTPQNFLATTSANVDAWDCPGPEPVDSTYPEDEKAAEEVEPTANLLFEIWDTQQRKMRIRVLDAVPLKRWVHIALTTTDANSIRPTWHVYVDGKKVFEEPDGHVPLKSYLTRNYIGRSNWEGVTTQYEDADERFRGSLFDFRLYRQPMSGSKINRTVEWGRQKLGLLKKRDGDKN